MDDFVDPILLDLDRYAIGQPVPRSEDPVLVSGKGRFTDDIDIPGQAYCAIVRSHHAHGIIRGIDTAAARGMPGVRGVYTAADLEAGGVGPMEPRSGVAQYDVERQHWTLHVPGQGVFGFRNYIAGVFGVGRDKLRVITDRVGGSFGMKQPTYAEYYCIMHAARELGRPVKWTDDRSGSFLSDTHGRDAEATGELALDRDGNFLAVRLTIYGNVGATYGAPGPPTRNAVRNTLGVYKTPLIEVSTKCMFTNTTPVGAYRGAGRPEANYYMERLVDAAAAEMGIDPVALRRRNHIPPEAMPYKAPNGTTYDSGDFTKLLNQALALADWDGFPARRQTSRARGRLRGQGISD